MAMLLAASLSLSAARAQAQDAHRTSGNGADKMRFWTSHARHGANCMNEAPPSAAYFREARSMGIEWMRLAYDKRTIQLWSPAISSTNLPRKRGRG